jgi:endonuclease/exonuclease/phosphatase family metal-dependent hydrolase
VLKVPEEQCVRRMACFPKKKRILQDNGIALENFDAVIWLGDFNYRVTASNPDVVRMLME